jgi:16S rRNA (cytidine1402-2'-O)-methyltransferase
MSERAREILATVDCVYCEDTRTTGRLLKFLGIKADNLRSLHAHNEGRRVKEVLEQLANGASIALVSDAGTPGISDPGTELVAAAHEAGCIVAPVPGPSALSAIMSVSGFPSRGLQFAGFLAKARGARSKKLQERLTTGATLVCFVPARDTLATLQTVAELEPNSLILLGRELTKRYEEVKRLPVADMIEYLSEHSSLKGEVVLAIYCPSGSDDKEDPKFTDSLREATRIMLQGGLSKRDTQRSLAALTGHPKNRVLKWVLEVEEDQ